MPAPYRGEASGAGYKILYHPDVVRDDIPTLDGAVQRRIKSAIAQILTEAPETDI